MWDDFSMFTQVIGILGGALLFGLLLLVNMLQISSLLVWPISRPLFRRVNRWCANTWWGLCVLWLENVNGIEFIATGDEMRETEDALLTVNHRGMADILSLFTLGYRKGRLGDMKWFVKDILKYVPGVGWGMLFLDCIFLKRDWTADRSKIFGTFETLKAHRVPFWLVLFSEGTRLTPSKLARSQAYAREKKSKIPQHVMIPRTKGFVASVLGLGSSVDAVYDVTIGYEGPSSFGLFLQGRAKKVHLHVRGRKSTRLNSSH